jgi:hypothetical protein
LEILLLSEVHKQQMANDAKHRKAASQIKDLKAESVANKSAAAGALVRAEQADKALASTSSLLASTETQLTQATQALAVAEAERVRLGALEHECRASLLETRNERDHLRLQVDKLEAAALDSSGLSAQLLVLQAACDEGARKIEVQGTVIQRLQDVAGKERALLKRVHQLVVASAAFEASLTCMLCTELMPDAVALPCGHCLCLSCWEAHELQVRQQAEASAISGFPPKRNKKACPECGSAGNSASRNYTARQRHRNEDSRPVVVRAFEALCANLVFQQQTLKPLREWHESVTESHARFEGFKADATDSTGDACDSLR